MEYDPQIHHRRSIRLQGYDYSCAGMYFVTLCTYGKEHLFGEVVEGEMKLNKFGELLALYWNHLTKRYTEVRLDSFVVMPNHIHGIIGLTATVGAIHELPLRNRRDMLLPKVIGYFKMNTGKRINEMRATQGRPLWQRNYYEHIIRNQGELANMREYIATNPLRWASDPENSTAEITAGHQTPWL